MKRASFSSSPLSRPENLIHVTASKIQDYLFFPSPDPLYIVLGTVVANMMKGPPVWIVLVGAPSSGRTVLLQALSGLTPDKESQLPGVHIVGGGIKGPAAFLSGSGKREITRQSTGGLLRQIGSRGILVMKDFSSMLAMPHEPLAESIDVLRQTYDGHYSRPVGTDGGKHIEWRGQIGFIAASTPTIDRHMKAIGELGERWVYYRYPGSDGHGETIKALGTDDPQAMADNLKGLVSQFFEASGVEWDQDRRSLTQQEREKLYAMAVLSTSARSSVSRDYRTGEVDDITSREGPPRLAMELGQLYLGLEAIGLSEQDAWRLIGKIALDSVRQARMKVMLSVYGAYKTLTMAELRQAMPIGRKALDTIIEDLALHGILEKIKAVRDGAADDGPNGLRLTAWAKEKLEIGWNGVLKR